MRGREGGEWSNRERTGQEEEGNVLKLMYSHAMKQERESADVEKPQTGSVPRGQILTRVLVRAFQQLLSSACFFVHICIYYWWFSSCQNDNPHINESKILVNHIHVFMQM